MSKFLNRRRSGATISEIFVEGRGKIGGVQAAELMNTYFCEIGTVLAKRVPPAVNKFYIDKVNCKFKWGYDISESEVRKEVLALSSNKSSGLPHLNCKALNIFLDICVMEFTSLLNLCVSSGIFPDKWKEGTVIPIPKGNKKLSLENIRPISLLPTPGKVLEHFMYRQIYMYFMEHELFTRKQSGFRKYYGIHDPTIDLVKFIHTQFNQKLFVVCTYIDMAKAFNSLDINILMYKLSQLGFGGKELELLQSYSRSRRQVTNLGGTIYLRKVKGKKPVKNSTNLC